jgi:hypothetical protein
MEQPTTVRKPEGGFVFISVRQVCRAWVAYQQRLIHIVDLWVWFAAQELVARRCQVQRGQPIHYQEAELTRLVGGTHSMPVSLRRLAQAGLLHWAETTLTFPDERSALGDSEALTTMLTQIANRDRRIPVPRRLIRYLAGGCPKVMVATILGHLMRCLYYRQGECRPTGHCKATWIATVFGVSLRQVKQTRHLLEELGLVQRSTTVQWVLNRYGQTMTFNLQWEGPRYDTTPRDLTPVTERLAAGSAVGGEASGCGVLDPAQEPLTEGPCLTLNSSTLIPITDAVADPLAAPVSDAISPVHIAPLPHPKSAEIAPPDSHAELSTRREHQKPARRGAPGLLTTLFLEARIALREGRAPKAEEGPAVMRSVPASGSHVPSVPASSPVSETLVKELEDSPAETPLPTPSLRHILVQDLRETGRLLQLYAQAVTAGLIGSSEADRLAFVALAHHVLSYRPANPGGLFTQLLRTRHFDYATQDDEDSAVRRLKRHLYGGSPAALQPVVETALRRAG